MKFLAPAVPSALTLGGESGVKAGPRSLLVPAVLWKVLLPMETLGQVWDWLRSILIFPLSWGVLRSPTSAPAVGKCHCGSLGIGHLTGMVAT